MEPVPAEAASIVRRSETGRRIASISSSNSSITGICTVIIMFTSGHRCFTKEKESIFLRNRKEKVGKDGLRIRR